MKKIQKTIALFLTVALLMTVVQIPIFAATYNASQIVLSVDELVGSKNKLKSDLDWVEQQFLNHYGLELKMDAINTRYVADIMIDSTSDKNIPLGAVVFFEETTEYDIKDTEKINYVGIHVGNNNIIHAFDWDSQGSIIAKDKISTLIRSERYAFRGWGWYSDVRLTDDTFDFSIKDPDTYPKFPGVIENGSSNYPVASYYVLFIQEGLGVLGFDVIPNGIFDSSTIQAVKAFQSQNNLKANGNVDNDTWGTLCSLLNKKYGKDIESDIPEKENIKISFDITNPDTYPKMRYDYYAYFKDQVMYGEDVAFIQAALKDLGFDAVVDGYYEATTAKAVYSFQKQNNLDYSSIVDRDTWGTLVGLLEKKYTKDIIPEVPDKEPEYDKIPINFDITNPDTYPKMRYDEYYYSENNDIMRGEDVAFIQAGLRDLGFDAIVNGYYDYSTSKVVYVFQKQYNLKANSIVSPDVWGTLVSLLEKKYAKDIIPEKEIVKITFNIKKPSTYPKMKQDYYAYNEQQIMFGEDVAFIQAGLQALGYDIVVDGYFNYSTQKVVTIFQEQNNLKSNGIVYSNTWNKIVSKLEKKYSNSGSSSGGGSSSSGGGSSNNDKETEKEINITFDITNPNTYPKMKYDYYEYYKNQEISGEDVAFIQAALKDLGYDIKVDGYFDYSTSKVVYAFQKQNYLKGDGVVTIDTWETLVALLTKKYEKDVEKDLNVTFDITKPSTYPKMGRDYYDYNSKKMLSGNEVVFIQLGLSALGYDIVVSNYYNYETAKVVEVFQRQNYLKNYGVVDQETWNTMVSLLEKKFAENEKEDLKVSFDITNPDTYPKMNRDYYTYYKEQTFFGEDIAFIQAGLRDLGFDIVVNGYYDYATAKVVIIFQEQNHMSSDGVFTQDTWGTLVSMLEKKYAKDDMFDKDLPVPDIDNPFQDVKDKDYFYAPVLWAYDNEITKGMSDIDFVPYGDCTRGQAVTFLWRASGSPEPQNIYNSFVDISPNDYYYKAVLWAVENGITTGTGGGYFSPNIKCSNAHILTFLWRSMGTPDKTNSDIWYEDALNWAEKSQLLKGTYSNEFDVNSDAFRANIVTYLYKYFGGEKPQR